MEDLSSDYYELYYVTFSYGWYFMDFLRAVPAVVAVRYVMASKCEYGFACAGLFRLYFGLLCVFFA